MSDDIVARLRNKHADDPLAWEVADEIERLRKELAARCGDAGPRGPYARARQQIFPPAG